MAIRYDDKINREIDRTLRNFNNKIRRLEKTNRDLILPETLSKKELKTQVSNRNDLKRVLKTLQSYSKRGMEETITTKGGAKISRYEYNKIKTESRRIKTRLTINIKKLGNITPTIYGKEQDATIKQMGSQRLANLKARREALNKNINDLDTTDLTNYKKRLAFNIQKDKYLTEIFKDNYINKMLYSLAYLTDYDEEKLNEIRKKLSSLDDDNFLKLFDTEQSIQAIKEYYPTIYNSSIGRVSIDINELYDNLYNNLDNILKDYK